MLDCVEEVCGCAATTGESLGLVFAQANKLEQHNKLPASKNILPAPHMRIAIFMTLRPPLGVSVFEWDVPGTRSQC